jgi:hypothetical protein
VPDLQSQLRDDLRTAMRARDRELVRVLRTVLSAIANAESQPDLDETPLRDRSDGPIAGAVEGLAAAEVARRELDTQEVRAIVEAERDERLSAADNLATRGAVEAAEALRAEATLLDRYVG